MEHDSRRASADLPLAKIDLYCAAALFLRIQHAARRLCTIRSRRARLASLAIQSRPTTSAPRARAATGWCTICGLHAESGEKGRLRNIGRFWPVVGLRLRAFNRAP